MNKFRNIVFTCASITLAAASVSSSADAGFVFSGDQVASTFGYYPYGDKTSYSFTTGPNGVTNDAGSANSNLATTNDGFVMTFSLGLNVDTKGYSYVEVVTRFTADSSITYHFHSSITPAGGTEEFLNVSLHDNTDDTNALLDGNYSHSLFDTVTLTAGHFYTLDAKANINYDQFLHLHGDSGIGSATGSISFAIAPEPSSLALMSLGGVGIGISIYRKRRMKTMM